MYQPETQISARGPLNGPRVDIGRGRMQGMISKWPYHNLFIIYLKIKRTVCSITLNNQQLTNSNVYIDQSLSESIMSIRDILRFIDLLGAQSHTCLLDFMFLLK